VVDAASNLSNPSTTWLKTPWPARAPVRVVQWGEGPPLLLLNGLSRPVESWAPLAAHLPGRRLITFDAPGIGESPRSLYPLSIPVEAAQAAYVLNILDVVAADVLGYSFGGAVAQQLALEHPEKVHRLILAATTPGVGAPIGDVTALALFPHDPSWPTSDPLAITWRLAAIATWSSLALLPLITSPTLVVSGDHDRVVPKRATEILASLIPTASRAVLKAGHDLQEESVAPSFSQVIEEFLHSDFPCKAP
jgi:poly(3-hydroxyoctanoate) depolymerase